jgi:hypothetical protein
MSSLLTRLPLHSAEFSAYLAPFAQEGKVVTEADVNAFFAARKQQEGKR